MTFYIIEELKKYIEKIIVMEEVWHGAIIYMSNKYYIIIYIIYYMKVISFCIYGSQQKYCIGLLENIEIIKNKLPDFYIFIYVGNGVPNDYIEKYSQYDKVRIFYTNVIGYNTRIHRFFAIDEDDVNVMIVRDCDSRIHNRDIWCILHFIQSKYYVHTIRDHPEHRSHIMAGLWGLKKGLLNRKLRDIYSLYNKNNIDFNEIQHDQSFLRDMLYNTFIKYMIIYVNNQNLRLTKNEIICLIPFKIQDNEFCGQVIEYNKNNEAYIKYIVNESNTTTKTNYYGINNLSNMSNIFKN